MSGIIVVGVDASGTARKAAETARDLAVALSQLGSRGQESRSKVAA